MKPAPKFMPSIQEYQWLRNTVNNNVNLCMHSRPNQLFSDKLKTQQSMTWHMWKSSSYSTVPWM